MIETTETNGAQDEQVESQISDEQWKAIKKVIDNLYAHREPE